MTIDGDNGRGRSPVCDSPIGPREIPSSEGSSPSDLQNKTFLDSILNAIQLAPVSLDALEEEDGAVPETDAEKYRSLMMADQPPFLKAYFTQKDRQLLGEISRFAGAEMDLKNSRPQIRKTLLEMRKDLVTQFGENGQVTPSQQILVDSIVWLSLIEHILASSALRFGVLKVNRSSGKFTMQGPLEKSLIPLVNCKRLCLKTLAEISRDTVNRKMTVRFSDRYDSDRMTEEELDQRIRELEAMLGRPPRQIESITIQEARREQLSSGDGEDCNGRS
jgi:hypothetical protein